VAIFGPGTKITKAALDVLKIIEKTQQQSTSATVAAVE
jgi:hypothetical protein